MTKRPQDESTSEIKTNLVDNGIEEDVASIAASMQISRPPILIMARQKTTATMLMKTFIGRRH